MRKNMCKYELLNNSLDAFGNVVGDLFRPVFCDDKFDLMKTDIKEVEGGWLMDIELPGYDKKDIKVSVEDGYVTVKAAKTASEESDKNNRFVKRERSCSCSRSYYVGDVNEKEIKAKYENGVLKLNIPKEEPKPEAAHTIEIE